MRSGRRREADERPAGEAREQHGGEHRERSEHRVLGEQDADELGPAGAERPQQRALAHALIAAGGDGPASTTAPAARLKSAMKRTASSTLSRTLSIERCTWARSSVETFGWASTTARCSRARASASSTRRAGRSCAARRRAGPRETPRRSWARSAPTPPRAGRRRATRSGLPGRPTPRRRPTASFSSRASQPRPRSAAAPGPRQRPAPPGSRHDALGARRRVAIAAAVLAPQRPALGPLRLVLDRQQLRDGAAPERLDPHRHDRHHRRRERPRRGDARRERRRAGRSCTSKNTRFGRVAPRSTRSSRHRLWCTSSSVLQQEPHRSRAPARPSASGSPGGRGSRAPGGRRRAARAAEKRRSPRTSPSAASQRAKSATPAPAAKARPCSGAGPAWITARATRARGEGRERCRRAGSRRRRDQLDVAAQHGERRDAPHRHEREQREDRRHPHADADPREHRPPGRRPAHVHGQHAAQQAGQHELGGCAEQSAQHAAGEADHERLDQVRREHAGGARPGSAARRPSSCAA